MEAQGHSPSPPPTNLTDVALDEGRVTPAQAAAAQLEEEDEPALPTHHAAPAIYHLPGGMQVSEAEPLGQLLTRLKWASERCIEGMDYVGGKVAGFLGVTDSRFQYVLDQVSEEDLAAARTDLRVSRHEGGPLLLEEISHRKLQQQQQSDAAVGGPNATLELAGSGSV